MVDLTPPESGSVADGDPDITYSSEPAMVDVAWAGFQDPESGHLSVDWNIYRKPKGQREGVGERERERERESKRERERERKIERERE